MDTVFPCIRIFRGDCGADGGQFCGRSMRDVAASPDLTYRRAHAAGAQLLCHFRRLVNSGERTLQRAHMSRIGDVPVKSRDKCHPLARMAIQRSTCSRSMRGVAAAT